MGYKKQYTITSSGIEMDGLDKEILKGQLAELKGVFSGKVNYQEEYYKLLEAVKAAHKTLGVGNLDHVDSRFFSGHETIMDSSKILRSALDHHQKLFPPKQDIPHE